MAYHDGELEMQRRAGVADQAARMARMVGAAIPDVAAGFLAGQRMIVLGFREGDGRLRVRALTGPAGFARADGDRVLQVDAPISPSGPAAVLAIDFALRRRMRVNGDAEPRPGGFRIRTREVYANCPKYIHPRAVVGSADRREAAPRSTTILSEEQRTLIAAADTFFIATSAGGADVSHRGGAPGFVRVTGPSTLEWDDYAGNTMFNTLGNLLRNPEAALLFIDFASGRTLELRGRARVLGDEDRRIEVAIDELLDDPAGHELRWSAP